MGWVKGKFKREGISVYVQEKSSTSFIYYCVDHNKLWKTLSETGIPDHLICLLRNLYAGREATVRTGLGTMDWFQIGKGLCPGCIMSPCLLNLYAEYIMRSARLDEAQAGIKAAGRYISNFREAEVCSQSLKASLVHSMPPLLGTQ